MHLRRFIFIKSLVLFSFPFLLSCEKREAQTAQPASTVQRGIASKSCKNAPAGYRSTTTGRAIVTSCPGRRGRRMHQGIDIAGKYGSAIKSSGDGQIIYAGTGLTCYGRTVIVDQGGGRCKLYAHLSKITKSSGRVRAGEKIGAMGNSGCVARRRGGSGTHLHYESRSCSIYRGFSAVGSGTSKTRSGSRGTQKSSCTKVRAVKGRRFLCETVPFGARRNFDCEFIRDQNSRHVNKWLCAQVPTTSGPGPSSGAGQSYQKRREQTR